MRKKIIFGISILLICLAGWGIYKVSKPHRNVESEQAVATLTATNLYNEFLNTESQANKKWVGKVIEVSGIISSVNESADYVSINLKAATDGGVNCSVLKTELGSDNQLKTGNSITIKGRCTGFLMDVNLVDCVIKK